MKPKRCEQCGGRFPLKDPAACHVMEVPEGVIPVGAPENGKHYFCKESCADAYAKKLDQKYPRGISTL